MSRDDPPSLADYREAKRRIEAERRKAKATLANESDGFVHGGDGQILKGHPKNIKRAIELLGVTLRLNLFTVLIEISGFGGPILDDGTAVDLRMFVHEKFGFLPSRDLFEEILGNIARANAFHPVREYLDGLKWDGWKRLSSWFSHYLGVDHTDYVETVGKAFFLSMVARIYLPGCKQDHMVILEGPQGTLKSMACGVIAGKWFSDGLPDVRDAKDCSQHLKGKWLIEVGELSAMSKAETNTLKAFITRDTERYRPSYGRLEVEQPRQCLFIGTTNADCYLKDSTGGRRFWPIKTGVINIDTLTSDRDQLFAEAVHLFKAGEKWWADKDFEIKHIKPEQDARLVIDPWQDEIARFIKGREKTTVWEVAKGALFIETARISTRESYRIVDVLTALGWTQKRGTGGVRWYAKA